MELEYMFHCPVCDHNFTTHAGWRRTCSSPCAEVYARAPYLFSATNHFKHRLGLVRHIVRHSKDFPTAQVKWATRAMQTYLKTGSLPPVTGRWASPDSYTRELMIYTLGEDR